MEVNQNQNQFKAVQHWSQLHTFYGKMASMSMTLVDSDCSVQVKITPAIQGMENARPTEGVKKFDYTKSVAITLNIGEIASIVSSYKTGAINQVPITFFHKVSDDPSTGKAVGIIGGLSIYEGRIMFGITDQRKGQTSKFFFSSSKFGQQGSEIYIQTELTLFISILESVLNNIVMIKNKMLPVYIPKGDNKQTNQQNNFTQNTQYQNTSYQQNEVQQNVQSNYGYNQNNIQQQSSPNQQKLPQSVDVAAPSTFDF